MDTVLSASPAFQLLVNSPTLALCTAFALVILTTAALKSFSLRQRSQSICDLGGISFLTAWPFFKKRHDFIWANFKKTGAKMFRFRVAH
ncbi:hypothetical protein H0H92_015825, partial [Tricholoma furcatifolium]